MLLLLRCIPTGIGSRIDESVTMIDAWDGISELVTMFCLRWFQVAFVGVALVATSGCGTKILHNDSDYRVAIQADETLKKVEFRPVA